MRRPRLDGRLRYVRLAWQHLREFRWLFVLSVAVILAASFFELAGVALIIPLLEQMGPSAGNSQVSQSARTLVGFLGVGGSLVGLLGLYAGLTLIKFILTEWAAYTGRVLSASIRYRMRQRVFDNLMDLPLSFYYTRRSGDIIASADTSTTEAAALAEGLVRLLNVIIFAAVYITVQLLLSVWMTVAVLAFTALSYVLVSPRFTISYNQGEHAKRLFDATVSFLQDRLSGMKTIKAFGNADVHRAEFDKLGRELRGLAISMQKNKIIAHAFGEPFTTIAVVAILVLALQVLKLGVVEMLAFFYAYSLLIPRVKALTTESLTIVEKLPHFAKVQELIDRHDKQYLAPGHLPFKRLETDITFKNVSFAYGPAGPLVLDAVNVTFERMKTTALVGPSGVGKTTIGDLLLRLHDPTRGAVMVNGRDLREFTDSSWHKRIAVVEQEPFLFHDTILNNIRYGKPEASEEEVLRAARLAHADVFIEHLAQGYDTMVGQRGITLSGGQRQRIAMARALIRKPDLLVLDEATSALDSESERFIQKAIDEIRSQCTMVIIAHRLSTIASADNILILEAGRVVEQGTHADLIAREGLYARYYVLQTEKADAQAGTPEPVREI